MEASAKSRPGHRERLLEAAIACLQERGYAHTTARDLVAASGTNLASIGYHFGSKDHLLNVALVEAFRRWLEPIVRLAAEPGPAGPLERLERSLAEVTSSLEEQSGLVSACVEAWAQVPRSDDLRIQMAASYADFRGVIADIARDAFAEIGAPEDLDHDALATLIIAVFDGLLVRAQLAPDEVPDAPRLLGALGAVIGLLGERSG